jgi:DUF1680 family protein
VPERSVGAFAGWPSANDWGSGMALCCTGNATRALYYVWEHMVGWRDGELCVNLLLNRPSPWADVDSHLPNRGRVDVHLKRPCRLRIRLPSWVAPADVRCTVNGADRRIGWNGRYAVVGSVVPGDTASLAFPIAEHAAEAEVEGRSCRFSWRGHDVVAVDPPGELIPFYQRDHLRGEDARWRRARRFVSAETLEW